MTIREAEYRLTLQSLRSYRISNRDTFKMGALNVGIARDNITTS